MEITPFPSFSKRKYIQKWWILQLAMLDYVRVGSWAWRRDKIELKLLISTDCDRRRVAVLGCEAHIAVPHIPTSIPALISFFPFILVNPQCPSCPSIIPPKQILLQQKHWEPQLPVIHVQRHAMTLFQLLQFLREIGNSLAMPGTSFGPKGPSRTPRSHILTTGPWKNLWCWRTSKLRTYPPWN